MQNAMILCFSISYHCQSYSRTIILTTTIIIIIIIIINLPYDKENLFNYKMQTPKYSYMTKACGVASDNFIH
jgi:hypothetical protein